MLVEFRIASVAALLAAAPAFSATPLGLEEALRQAEAGSPQLAAQRASAAARSAAMDAMRNSTSMIPPEKAT